MKFQGFNFSGSKKAPYSGLIHKFIECRSFFWAPFFQDAQAFFFGFRIWNSGNFPLLACAFARPWVLRARVLKARCLRSGSGSRLGARFRFRIWGLGFQLGSCF